MSRSMAVLAVFLLAGLAWTDGAQGQTAVMVMRPPMVVGMAPVPYAYPFCAPVVPVCPCPAPMFQPGMYVAPMAVYGGRYASPKFYPYGQPVRNAIRAVIP